MHLLGSSIFGVQTSGHIIVTAQRQLLAYKTASFIHLYSSLFIVCAMFQDWNLVNILRYLCVLMRCGWKVGDGFLSAWAAWMDFTNRRMLRAEAREFSGHRCGFLLVWRFVYVQRSKTSNTTTASLFFFTVARFELEPQIVKHSLIKQVPLETCHVEICTVSTRY